MNTIMPGENGLSPEKLDQALAIAEDYLGRAQIPFLVLGNTLEGVIKAELFGDKVELGVRERYLTDDTLGMLKIVNPDLKVEGDKICFAWEGVPVEIKVIKRNYKFFENPDSVFYKVTEYKIPNPLETYRKARYLIK